MLCIDVLLIRITGDDHSNLLKKRYEQSIRNKAFGCLQYISREIIYTFRTLDESHIYMTTELLSLPLPITDWGLS